MLDHVGLRDRSATDSGLWAEVIGLLQSVTQLQEPTLTFVPKLVGSAVVIAVAGNWMLASLVSFAHDLIAGMPNFVS